MQALAVLRKPTPGSVAWIGFFAAVLAAWAVMYAMARRAGVDWLGPSAELCGNPMDGFAHLFPMWTAMMAAMMLPTMIPTLRVYDGLIRSGPGSRDGWLGLLAGYLAVWTAFSAAIAAAQIALVRLGMLDAFGALASPWASALLLLAAGAFQFAPAKTLCHSACVSPMAYFVGRWRPGVAGGLRMGLGLGAFCVGCCWAIMLLGFVGGAMNLAFMGIATLFMVLEKLPDIGRHLVRPAGAALIAAGLHVAAGAALAA